MKNNRLDYLISLCEAIEVLTESSKKDKQRYIKSMNGHTIHIPGKYENSDGNQATFLGHVERCIREVNKCNSEKDAFHTVKMIISNNDNKPDLNESQIEDIVIAIDESTNATDKTKKLMHMIKPKLFKFVRR